LPNDGARVLNNHIALHAIGFRRRFFAADAAVQHVHMPAWVVGP
jgi:hypothetical protein